MGDYYMTGIGNEQGGGWNWNGRIRLHATPEAPAPVQGQAVHDPPGSSVKLATTQYVRWPRQPKAKLQLP